MRRVLFIANGLGEDSIAAAIIAKLPSDIEPAAYPVVGSGKAYDGLCPIVGPRAHIPSEGWRHTSGSVARDIKGGMLSSVRPAINFLKEQRGTYDRVVTVGDAVTPLLCRLAGLKIDIYLDVFKSGYAHRYSFLERWLIKSVARRVYCRDDMLAAALRDAGVDAKCAGNIMLDTVPYGRYGIGKRRTHAHMITLMPGSREWTGESLALQLAALKKLPEALMPDIFVAVAGGVDIADLTEATGLQHKKPKTKTGADLGRLEGDGLVVHLARGVAGNLIEESDVVLSQAGTGTQQALGLGKPVITINRADNRPKRMRDEQALMGEGRILVPEDPDALASALTGLLENEDERARRGTIGRERLGGPGTLDAVIADLTS